jgi:choline kinase
MVILAAGEGRRLRPLTVDRPKVLVDVAGKSLLDWQLEAASRRGIESVAVVTGFMANRFRAEGYRLYHNPRYADTNMVATLWCAEPEFHGELIVSYGDILYEDSVLQSIIDSDAPVSVVIDLDWRGYWQQRFADPLTDAESLRLHPDGRIIEIGQRPASIGEIQGQYIGLTKFQGHGIDAMRETYLAASEHGTGPNGGKPVGQMYMTDLLQAMIDSGHEVRAVEVHRGWLEVDSLADFELANLHTKLDPQGPRISI